MASEETMTYLKGLADGTRRTPGQELGWTLYQAISTTVQQGTMTNEEAFGALLTVVAVILRQQPQERRHTTMLETMAHITTAVYGDE